MSFYLFISPSLVLCPFLCWKEHRRRFQVHLIRKSRDGDYDMQNEALLSELTFVRNPNRGEVTRKGGNTPPPPLPVPSSNITSTRTHWPTYKPSFFPFRSKGYTQQRKACVERKRTRTHTSVYFYTVKTIDRSTAPKVREHLSSTRVDVGIGPRPGQAAVSGAVYAEREVFCNYQTL